MTMRLRATEVPFDRLLVGGEAGISARQYALLIQDLKRPSTRFAEGPHVTFLQQYRSIGDRIFDRRAFESTPYFRNARACIDLTGRYFAAAREDQVVLIAKQFVDRYENRVNSAEFLPEIGQTSDGIPIVVQPVEFSRSYSVVDGNHRLAIEYMNGRSTALVSTSGQAEITPLQQMLGDVLWTRGSFELYQPVDLPECRDRWVVVRKCTDRLAMIERVLRNIGLLEAGATFLDIGSYYGWFVHQMSRFGLDSYGIERDPISAQIGTWAYGVRPQQILVGDCARLLADHSRAYDVVSFQSILHHFIINRSRCTPEELIRLVEGVTKRVLFFETGQSHEAWFRRHLAEWTPDFIENWLKLNTRFARVIRVGVDEDAVGDYRRNYGRTLFACIR